MKKCPKCKAEIQEEARFCLYCMTSFEEKKTVEPPKENNKRGLIIIAAVLTCLVLGGGILLLVKGCDPVVTDPPAEAPMGGESADNAATEEDRMPMEEENNVDLPVTDDTVIFGGDFTQASDSDPVQNMPPQNNTTQNNTTQNNTTQGNTANKPTVNDTTTSIPAQNTEGTPSQEQSTQIPVVTQPSYTYVDATNVTAYPDWYHTIQQVKNAVVITRVNHVAKDGIYVIPDTLDGKKVVAIMPGAFGDAAVSGAVRSVTLPSSVRTVWNEAFKDCVYLEDLYLKTSAVEIYANAFPEVERRSTTLTIHCQKDCRNLNFYYYRSIAPSYGAVYAEWNG